MKILFILHQTYACGGANKSFLTLACALRNIGVDVHVAVPDNKDIYKDLVNAGFKTIVVIFRYGTYPDVNGIKNIFLFIPRLIARRIVLRKAVSSLSKYVKKNGIDIIHSNTSVLDLGYYLSRKNSIPHITHVREYGNLDFGYKYFPSFKFFHRHFYKPLQYSICITKDIQYFHKLTDSKSQVIYDGIFHKKQLSCDLNGKHYFLYVGRIQEAKGLYDLIKAYVLFVKKYNKKIPLKVIGKIVDQTYYTAIIKYICDNNIGSSVDFLGERTDVTKFMNEAISIIIPSLSEGFGRCMPEAMFNGCLVIGRNTAGTKEQFDNGLIFAKEEIGIRFNNVEELAIALHRAATIKVSEKQKIICNAFNVVNEMYSIETSTSHVISMYKEILGSQR